MQPLTAFNYWDIVFLFSCNGLMFKVFVQYLFLMNQLCTRSLSPLANSTPSYCPLLLCGIFKYYPCCPVFRLPASPYVSMETHFQHQFLMNVWCWSIGNHMIAPFVSEHSVWLRCIWISYRRPYRIKTVVAAWWCTALCCLTLNRVLWVLHLPLWSMDLACKVTRSHAPSSLVGHLKDMVYQQKCRQENCCRELWNYHKAINSLFFSHMSFCCGVSWHSFLLMLYIQQVKTSLLLPLCGRLTLNEYSVCLLWSYLTCNFILLYSMIKYWYCKIFGYSPVHLLKKLVVM